MHRSDGRQAVSTDGEGGCSPHSGLQTSIHVEAREFVLTKRKSAVLPAWCRTERARDSSCRSTWLPKTKLLPWLYWSHMFKDGEFDIPHRARGW
jgi:hypothetical protein